jgi:hypothetical protein
MADSQLEKPDKKADLTIEQQIQEINRQLTDAQKRYKNGNDSETLPIQSTLDQLLDELNQLHSMEKDSFSYRNLAAFNTTITVIQNFQSRLAQ